MGSGLHVGVLRFAILNYKWITVKSTGTVSFTLITVKSERGMVKAALAAKKQYDKVYLKQCGMKTVKNSDLLLY